MKGVQIFLSDGFEDMEALSTRDILLRGGVPVQTVSITDARQVTSSHGLTVLADLTFPAWVQEDDRQAPTERDIMIFPGGMPGSQHLADHAPLMDALRRHYARGGAVAAICAAPGLVLSKLEGLEGTRFTCFDGFEDPLLRQGAVRLADGTVTDGRIITGKGAGWALEFGLAILTYLAGDEAAARVKKGLMR